MVNTETFEFQHSSPQPIFFFSHGGPTFSDRADPTSDTGAWDATRRIGKFIQEKVKPKFIIVVSAHWQATSDDEILVTIPGPGEKDHIQSDTVSNKLEPIEHSLIYDFYNWPQKFYDSQLHTYTNKAIVNDIVKTLKEAGVKNVKTQERGLDHGAFVPLKVAFADDVDTLDSHKWDLDVPVILVSEYFNDKIAPHFQLGQILSKYRDLGGVLLLSGMSVHNLVELRSRYPRVHYTDEYVEPFNALLTQILTDDDSEKVLKKLELLETDPDLNVLYQKAHPTNEHFLPAVIGAGAARGDKCEEIYTGLEACLGWNVYGWGDLNGL